MIFSIPLFKIISVITSDQRIFLSIVVSVADTAAGNHSDIKTPLPRYPPSWFLTFSVVALNKLVLFSWELITFIISFISMFVSVIPGPVIDKTFFSENIKAWQILEPLFSIIIKEFSLLSFILQINSLLISLIHVVGEIPF